VRGKGMPACNGRQGRVGVRLKGVESGAVLMQCWCQQASCASATEAEVSRSHTRQGRVQPRISSTALECAGW
jgi:hypothetical protein